jgi:hypothetical protein
VLAEVFRNIPVGPTQFLAVGWCKAANKYFSIDPRRAAYCLRRYQRALQQLGITI